MATYYYGKTGYLSKRMSIGGQDVDVKISRILDWSIEASVDMVETTNFESNAATYIPGKQTASGSCSILYYRDNTAITQQANNADFTQLLEGIFKTTNSSPQDRFLLTLGFTDDPSKDRVRAYVYVTGAQITCSTTEMAQAQLQFTVDGHFVDVFDKTV